MSKNNIKDIVYVYVCACVCMYVHTVISNVLEAINCGRLD